MSSPREACPKCGEARREDRAACPRCGLMVDRWTSFTVAPPAPSEPLAAAWTKLLDSWEEESAHKRLLDLAANLGELDTAAALYRHRLRERPEDPFARQGLERAAHLAAVMGGQRAATAEVPRSLRVASILVAVGLVVVVLQLLRVTLHW